MYAKARVTPVLGEEAVAHIVSRYAQLRAREASPIALAHTQRRTADTC